MPLDPALKQMLAHLPVVPDGPVDYVALRREADGMIPFIIGPDGPIAVGSVEDMEIAAPGGSVPLRIYRPIGPAKGTLHFIHGGGWAVGNLDTIEHTARRFCRDLSMVVVTSTYRLAPENRFPAAFEDSLAAARWVSEHRATFGGDERPVIIGGDSAGGNLTAAICIAMRDDTELAAPFDCQLLLYPAVDLRDGPTRYASRSRDGDPTLPAHNLNSCVADYAGDANREDPRMSPIAANNLTGLPPALVVVVSVDPLRDEAIVYADRLREAGVRVEVMEFDNLTHGFVHFSGIIPAAAQATGEVLQRLKTML